MDIVVSKKLVLNAGFKLFDIQIELSFFLSSKKWIDLQSY
jgi:hypothetical protein